VSGSQAEPMSSLSRIAVDTHRLLTLDERDTVILSARIYSRNEKAIFRMLDHMSASARWFTTITTAERFTSPATPARKNKSYC